MKKSGPSQKLTIKREVLRVLAQLEVVQVVGGLDSHDTCAQDVAVLDTKETCAQALVAR